MKLNVGSTDRLIRLFVGIVLLLLPFVSGAQVFSSVIWTAICVVIGAVLIVTALIRFCPLYLPFHISTRKDS